MTSLVTQTQLQVIPDIKVLGPEVGAAVVVLWVVWQVYAPTLFGVETRLSPLFNIVKRTERVEDVAGRLSNRVEEMKKVQTHHIQVTRATARALDDSKDVTISSDEVDEYLVDNGIRVSDLTRETESGDE